MKEYPVYGKQKSICAKNNVIKIKRKRKPTLLLEHERNKMRYNIKM